jgi:ribonuclease Z
MKLIFLGTSASLPSLRRQVSATALDLGPEILLLDCGEGTQLQYRRARLRPGKLRRVLISHFHGDHLFGLPGLLTSLQMMSRKAPLHLIGPQSLKTYVDFVQRFSGFALEYELVFHPVDPESPAELIVTPSYRIDTIPLQHGRSCVGYVIVENDRPGKFNLQRAEELGIPSGPLRSRLQAGERVQLPDGRWVSPDEVLGPPRPGRRLVYALDTRPCEAVLQAAQRADVLIHDATFDHTRRDLAVETDHSTVVEAAELARAAQVKMLVLTHISTRYDEDDDEMLLEQARSVFENTLLAHDLMTVQVPRP